MNYVKNIKQVQEEMKRNAVKSLDDVEKECIRAKKYFLIVILFVNLLMI